MSPDTTLSDGGRDVSVIAPVDGVLRIAVSTDAPGNPLSGDAMHHGAVALRRAVAGDLDVGAVLLTGAGQNFCAGGDVRVFAAAPNRPAFIRGVADEFHGFIAALRDAHLPVVAAVTGWAAGAGLSIVTHCDIAVGGPATRFRPAYSGIGLSPDGGLTWTLPRIVGSARARRILLTNAVITGDDAYAWGLLGALVGDDEVRSVAETMALDIAAGPRQGLRAARDLLDRSPGARLLDHLDAEADSISRLSGTPEGIEGIDAFAEKRRPDFAAHR
ncbi:enoyl-CoA hydratase/isomerase family protein [Williamsia sterculiae]|uniref:2-(1,2-epoxy-1,2-dihydrophenyl)acetyl-CoA isomerase n=1 Tax=Williamsia sterculiae TaxID=1344003 RepID=A0A1N7G5L1_9NOCA|nr:enoyl-CoA hydratase-related protein [Williamsia sterculiae]SIS07716.1 2-(1,2-epoxy-1,2-dihydrophenyl)acetyl-CoA isomerase [Williamsia sterculiae]